MKKLFNWLLKRKKKDENATIILPKDVQCLTINLHSAGGSGGCGSRKSIEKNLAFGAGVDTTSKTINNKIEITDYYELSCDKCGKWFQSNKQDKQDRICPSCYF